MAQICVSLVEETTQGLIQRMSDLMDVADMFEIRGDMVIDLDLLTILRAKKKPLVYACHPASEGGRWADDDPRRHHTLMEATKRSFDYVDVEHRSGFFDVMVEKAGSGLIVSHHDREGMPEDLDELYAKMDEQAADIIKIAVTPQTISDVGRFLAFASRKMKAGGTPLIPIAMGPMGMLTRILAGRYGAPFTYAAAAAGAEAAPGQVPASLMADLYRVRDITPETKVYGIVGSDVTRSLSPVIHNRAFEARGIDAVYVPLQADSIQRFIAAVPALELSGFSVTRPFKVEIVPLLHEADEAAALCGSVNTVVVHDGMLQGSTTDGHGVVGPLRKRGELKGRTVVIVGAGGGARAAAMSLVRKGAHVTVLARDPDKAAFVAGAVGCASGDLAELRNFEWDVLVNATPIGSRSSLNETPIPAGLHRPGSVVLDMIYDPIDTRLLREAQAAGCTIVDGVEMLLAQAAGQFETWTGMEAPLDVMKSTVLYLVQTMEEGV